MEAEKIPMNRVDAGAAAVLIAISAGALCWEEFRTENPFCAFGYGLFLPLGIWHLWKALTHKVLDAKGISVWRFRKRIRFLAWEQVQQVGTLRLRFARENTDAAGAAAGY